jgi:hypothetical protein
MYHGIAVQIIRNSSSKGNQKIWDTARKMLLGGLSCIDARVVKVKFLECNCEMQ